MIWSPPERNPLPRTLPSPTLGGVVSLLVRSRRNAGWTMFGIDVLSIVGFWTVGIVVYTLTAGVLMIVGRFNAWDAASGMLFEDGAVSEIFAKYMGLAAVAVVLVAMPLSTVGASAAHLDSVGRRRRMATLRLLGTPRRAIALIVTAETGICALIGVLLGWATYLATLGLWSHIVLLNRPIMRQDMLLPWWVQLVVAVGIVAFGILSALVGQWMTASAENGWIKRSSEYAVVRVWRPIVFIVLLFTVMAILNFVPLHRGDPIIPVVYGIAFTLQMLAYNFLGPWVIRALMACLAVVIPTPTMMVAARHTSMHMRSVWRVLAGPAYVVFLFVVFQYGNIVWIGTWTHDTIMGVKLTGVMCFACATVAVLINQTADVLASGTAVRRYMDMGVPVRFFVGVRRASILVPLFIACFLAGCFGLIFEVTIAGTTYSHASLSLTSTVAAVGVCFAVMAVVVELCGVVERLVVRQRRRDND